MTKEERMAYMRKRFPQLENESADAIIPVNKRDIEDEARLMPGYQEAVRCERANKALTSDE